VLTLVSASWTGTDMCLQYSFMYAGYEAAEFLVFLRNRRGFLLSILIISLFLSLPISKARIDSLACFGLGLYFTHGPNRSLFHPQPVSLPFFSTATAPRQRLASELVRGNIGPSPPPIYFLLKYRIKSNTKPIYLAKIKTTEGRDQRWRS
jgi:hypothetical protein